MKFGNLLRIVGVMTGKLPEERKACSRYGLSPICAALSRSIPKTRRPCTALPSATRRHRAGPEAFPGGSGDGGTRGVARPGQEGPLEDCGPWGQASTRALHLENPAPPLSSRPDLCRAAPSPRAACRRSRSRARMFAPKLRPNVKADKIILYNFSHNEICSVNGGVSMSLPCRKRICLNFRPSDYTSESDQICP